MTGPILGPSLGFLVLTGRGHWGLPLPIAASLVQKVSKKREAKDPPLIKKTTIFCRKRQSRLGQRSIWDRGNGHAGFCAVSLPHLTNKTLEILGERWTKIVQFNFLFALVGLGKRKGREGERETYLGTIPGPSSFHWWGID
jgi:hypothetical protein